MTRASARFDNAKRRRPEDHERQRRLTPPYVLEPVRDLLGGIDLDPCTEPDNPTGASRFFTPPVDGARESWGSARAVFCNPPYGEAKDRWVRRCIEEGQDRRVVLLIPSHTETRIFQEALARCSSVLFIRARLRFGVPRSNGRQEAASHGSALLGFSVCLAPLAHLGVVLTGARLAIIDRLAPKPGAG